MSYFETNHKTPSGEANVDIPQLVEVVKTGRRGRPRKFINLDYLSEAISSTRHIPFTQLAWMLGVHRNMLSLHMKHHSIERRYSSLSNAALDGLITQFKERRPESGVRYILGFLRRQGVHVQHRHVIQSLRRVNHVGQVLCNRQVKCRHQYQVKRPNALWHIDGHHKLIRWRIVIHGVIDGFCRMACIIMYMNSWLMAPVGNRFTCKRQQQISHSARSVQVSYNGVRYSLTCSWGSRWGEHRCHDVHDNNKRAA